ncbi:uroporphyrinogen decarboxylase family protein [Thermogemmatispora tikiterensis]|uniref:Uroporphyrinogen decarboxylase (URO-D) domain-containing protein n=1 Tax=Thermogemmatispora tikiterensis TaxID=1825093 RepID=A0A328VDI3_9CHLR|nr:uroporphyrinogen decarboxylase family protein [Thermogemmatispora tikiterensis]RAQ94032.1 hypothetical protein A4R35_00710 [Thermogemmatispora tikiterensis]
MQASAAPQSIIKALIQGRPPARRLFVPLIFRLAAYLEQLPLSTFLVNPTKIANSLVALHRRLQTDGITCYFDPLLLVEALGCRLRWQADTATYERPTRSVGNALLHLPPEEITQRGRVPVALEVVRRVQGTVGAGPVLLIGLPAPLRSAQQIFGPEIIAALAAAEDEALESFEALVAITLALARACCLAGAHLLYFDEVAVPANFLGAWEAALEALWKTVRFHGALPLLSVPQPLPLTSRADEAPLLSLRPDFLEQAPPPASVFALALPPSGAMPAAASRWCQALGCVLVTTDGEMPYEAGIQGLEQQVNRMRALLAS